MANPQAEALNADIQAANPQVLAMLSERGRNIFFPSKGILGQTAEAKGKELNATIGIALEEDGSPLRLGVLAEALPLAPQEVFPYAPSPGKPELRQTWQQMLRQKNPSLGSAPVSLPVVTCALTHALSICGYLFLDPGDRVVSPDLYWGNYPLIFRNAYGAEFETFNTFAAGGFDVEALRQCLAAQPGPRKVVLLNFPNNPTGYTPTRAEAETIRDVLLAEAESGSDVVAIIDDAYFGLVYEKGVFEESLFALLAEAHERLLAVKVDGPTKEDYVWGFRVGFITYAIKGATEPLYRALEAKTGGAVRGSISNAAHPSQSLLLQAYTSGAYAEQKRAKYQTLRGRYRRIREILAAHPEYAESFEPLPFNSGYFMCLRIHGADPEAVRQVLLRDYSTGVIATSGVVRLAFSSVPTEKLAQLFANLHAAVAKARA